MIAFANQLRFTAMAPIACLGAPAAAQDEDLQFWIYLNGTFDVTDSITNTTEVSPRWTEDGDLLNLRTTFETGLTEGVKAGAGAAYVEFANGHEFRPHQQIVLSSGPVSARTRFEERFFEGADRVEFRLRQNAQFTQPLGETTQAWIGGEALFILQHRKRGNEERGDQWRGEIGLRQRLDEHFTVAAAYRAIYTPRDLSEDTLNHVTILTLAWKP